LHGDDDPVERRVPGRAKLPVRAQDAYVAVAGGVEAGAGAVGDLGSMSIVVTEPPGPTSSRSSAAW
jgi:hypothetical protein